MFFFIDPLLHRLFHKKQREALVVLKNSLQGICLRAQNRTVALDLQEREVWRDFAASIGSIAKCVP